MSELVVSAADTATQLRPQASIKRAATAVTAFVGRALKGPVNRPIGVASFNDYQRVFGGLWQPSTLSYAVEQYFQNGGREAIVVRICNGGRAPTLTLPAGATHLTLVGLSPGSREFLRAAVDYDGIADAETDRFNLVIQRIRAPGSEFIEDQEIYRCLSILPGVEHSVAATLTGSRLVRARGVVPRQRPDRTFGAASATAVGYVMSNGDGDDGETLTNYDVIGDARSGGGLFALLGAEPFNFLCVPPISRELDMGLPALLVALRICRQRQAMLLLDPPAAWSDAAAAIDGLRNWPLYSEDALMFYPRVLAFDRLRVAARAVPPPHISLRTLVAEAAAKSDWRELAIRRLALFVMTSIERGTRWVVYEEPGPALWSHVRSQMTSFFQALEEEGAFVGRSAEENYFVICDQRLNDDEHVAAGRFQLLFGFATSRPADFQTCLVTHEPGGSSVRPVSVNRYALPLQS